MLCIASARSLATLANCAPSTVRSAAPTVNDRIAIATPACTTKLAHTATTTRREGSMITSRTGR